MLLNMFIKMFAYFIILTLVKAVVNKVLRGKDSERSDKEGNEVIDKRVFANIYLVVAILFSIIFIVVGSFPSNVYGTTRIVLSAVAILINIMIYIVSIMYRLWFVRFEDKGIVYRNMFGKTYEYEFNSIEYLEIMDFNLLKVHLYDKSIIRISNSSNKLSIINMFVRHGITLKTRSSTDAVENEYTMEPTSFYKGISWACVIVSIVFLGMSVYSNTWIGIWFFGVLLICSIIALLMKMNAKIVVFPKGVVVKSFLKKDREVAYSKIKYIKRKISDNAQITYLYSDDGLEFKYSELYKNAAHFENVISKYKWKCK